MNPKGLMPFLRHCTLVLASVVPLCGCLFRSQRVEQPMAVPLKSASCEELIENLDTQAGRVQSMQATVDIDTSVGGEKKGTVTKYEAIRGYVLSRKPAMLRMIGLVPIVRDRAFDLVSDGHEFKLSIPPKNRFIIGNNDSEYHSTTEPLANLRPQHIYDALLLRPIDRQTEIAVCENETRSTTNPKGQKILQADYVLDVIRTGEHPFLSRKIVFNRVDLLPYRQLLFDLEGNVQTVAVYENYHEESGGINFPWRIEISRPQEEYAFTLTLVKLDLNLPLPDDKFVLAQPPGVEIFHLDKPDKPPNTSESRSQPSPNR
jgi:outer membrane lipoprotein-sorting protein